jgi:chaperonin GroEL (HSP60 family)
MYSFRQQGGNPTSTKDGVTVAKEVELSKIQLKILEHKL